MRLTHPSLIALSLLAAQCTPAPVWAAPYTFEGLSVGTLSGQDNWQDFFNAAPLQTVASVTPSHVGSPTNVATGTDQSFRENDGSYSFTPHSASATMAMMQFDVRPAGSDINTFALGNIGGFIDVGRLGPQFGISGGGTYVIRGATENAITSAPLTGTDAVSDWYRVRLVVDFTALGGNGTGTLYVQNLTDGETSMRVTPALSGVNLEILSMTLDSQNPATWDTMYLRSNGSGTQFDNLNPFYFEPPVPEPSTFALLSVGMVGLAVKRRRRRWGKP